MVNTRDAGLNVRDAPAGDVIETVPDGWTFRIVGGPETAVLEGKSYNWWEVREEEYEPSPIEGWVAEDFLEVVKTETLIPDTPPSYFITAHEQVESAINWATSSKRKEENWRNLCLGFVATAFGVTDIGWGCPQEGVNNCPMGGVEKLKKEGKFYAVENCWNPPRGALIFFSGKGKDPQSGLDYEKCGHIGIHLGDGRVVHAYGVARINDIAGSEGIEKLPYIDSYIGWAYPPREWFELEVAAPGKIAFVSERDGSRNIYIMNPDGSDVHKLISGGWPSWSPDGTQIAFMKDGDIYIMSRDGGGLRRLTNHPALDFDPAWSPDGTQIAFASKRSGNWEIYIINVDGSNLHNLTNHPALDDHPTWSPDGTKIAFRSDRENYSRIFVMNVDGGNVYRLIQTNEDGHGPDWSPDGNKIVFTSSEGNINHIYLVDADGSNVVRLATDMDGQHPTWSPDGKKIAFNCYIDGNFEICVVNVDGSDLHDITNHPAIDWHPDWSPILP